jgi:hypothetical protein
MQHQLGTQHHGAAHADRGNAHQLVDNGCARRPPAAHCCTPLGACVGAPVESIGPRDGTHLRAVPRYCSISMQFCPAQILSSRFGFRTGG